MQHPSGSGGPRAALPQRAGGTWLLVKRSTDLVFPCVPPHALVLRWAGRDLLLPIDGDLLDPDAVLAPCLPPRILPHWADPCDVLRRARLQVSGGGGAAIHVLLVRQHMVVSQRAVDRRRLGHIRGRGGHGLDVGDERGAASSPVSVTCT